MGESLRQDRRLPVALAAVGLLFSTILELVHVRAYVDPSATSFCSVDTKLDCTAVALSRFAVILQVPLPIWGVAGFVALLAAAWRRSIWLLPLSGIAAVASVALLLVELVDVGALCLLCEVVHVAAWALFGVALARRSKLERDWKDRSVLTEVFGPGALLVVVSVLLVPRYFAVFTWKGEIQLPTGTTAEGHHWVGAAEPELEIHEFTDYGCPYCRVASTRVLKTIAKDSTRLRLVRRQNPRMHCNDVGTRQCFMARTAYCAAKQGKFWQMDRWLFAHGAGQVEVDLDRAATDVGIDAAQLKPCVASPDTYAAIDAEARLARKRRLHYTPTYVVDGKRLKHKELYELLAERER